MASAQTCSYSSLYKSNNQIYPYTLPPYACRTMAVLANVTSLITNSSSNSPLRNVIRHSFVSSLPNILLKAQSTRGSINLAICLRFIRSWTQYCYSLAKIRLFLVTSKVLGKNVERVIKKLALCIQHNTAQKASPPLFWIIDLVQDVIILSNKVTIALQPSTYILNGCCD